MQTGRVISWNQDQGFGFIKPHGCGGENVFCHAKALAGNESGLLKGDEVRYTLGADATGRQRALNVEVTKQATGLPAGFDAGFLGLSLGAFRPPPRLQGKGKDKGKGKGKDEGKGKGKGKGTMQPNRRYRSWAATAEAGERRICMAYAAGDDCPGARLGGDCAQGCHLRPEAEDLERVAVAQVSKAKMRLLQQKWQDASGPGDLVQAWEVKNHRLDFLFSATKHNFNLANSSLDTIDGWHGTAEGNVLSIAKQGFDTSRRSGQVHGSGEYFAKDPNVSVGYAKGGGFMILCKLLLGNEGVDHTWVPEKKYYVLKQTRRNVQALPLFIIQFKAGGSSLLQSLGEMSSDAAALAQPSKLNTMMRGGSVAEEARRDAGMTAATTKQIWIGWLDPGLLREPNDVIEADVRSFLSDIAVAEIEPERNGVRVGANVRLARAIDRATFQKLQQRLYRGKHNISVDDEQPDNPDKASKPCPRLVGPAKACRGWNLSSPVHWHMCCAFSHAENWRPTFQASFSYEDLPRGSAKYDEIESDLLLSAPFPAAGGGAERQPRILKIRRICNKTLQGLYDERRAYTQTKQGALEEKELWHGTNVNAISDLLTHGLQPPADRKASSACPRSGGKGLCTTLCDRTCQHCTEPHGWDRCHMFGLGVYFADMAKKSHRYVRPARDASSGKEVYSLLRCRVCLGRPYLIESNLLRPDAMHDFVNCLDPSDCLEHVAEEYDFLGHDAFYVRGLQRTMKGSLGVYNSEYILFHSWQILPLYRVDYVLD